MDFIDHQARARTQSRRLGLLLLLAISLVLFAVNASLGAIWHLLSAGAPLPPHFVVTNSFVVLLFVGGGAWLESLRLADGGEALAHRLGARSLDVYDLRHQRLSNVVDEIAISAGIAVPEVFVLEDPSINALTAGGEPTRCAIIVTRGAIERLERAELQAIVAHEVAHIVHGDVAINTHAAGALYGLMSLSVMGRSMLAAAVPRPRHHGEPTVMLPWPILWLAGGALLAIGWIGHLAGRLIQAGLSRQRELLADARAVELTRQSDGLGRALRKVAGQRVRHLESEYADVVAHLLLVGQSRHHGWFDSHPALAQRIRRIYGRYMPPIESVIEPATATRPLGAGTLAPLAFEGAGFAASCGEQPRVPGPARCEDSGIATDLSVEALLGASMSAAGHASVLLEAVRALSPSLGQASRLLNGLVAAPAAHGGVHDVDALGAALDWASQPAALWLRVPLIEVLTARLRPWPLPLRERLLAQCRAAVEADGRVEKTEWIYFTLARHRLAPQEPAREPSLLDQRKALAELFGLAAAIGQQSARRTRDCLSRAAGVLGIVPPASTPDEIDPGALTRSLETLAAIAPLRKPLLLKSLSGLARHPDDALYQAFLAAVAAAIDCPPLRVRGAPPENDSRLEQVPSTGPC